MRGVNGAVSVDGGADARQRCAKFDFRHCLVLFDWKRGHRKFGIAEHSPTE
jgi:hypothetical protein